ncbi:ABC transporter permease [Rhizobium mongolense]|uniref:NitT/TauT family transport system permease protein n=2 Tax=Rhizobium mongolense TaxID=57676 RepID=A0ABR6IEU6_9HYPH|nr:ABC transporter permease [Rhizobium mongolense]MBB4226382.1 NitT/TauT family transport system permease protein [Rhizobium mongolense]TVZ73657.1 NitT/TauT family transport system permease protein [Rhizobium mongolense USDA 1844]
MSAPQILLAEESANARSAYANIAAIEQKLGPVELIWGIGAVRKALLITVLALLWQVYATYLDNPLLFPTLTDTLVTLVDRFADGTLPARIWTTLKILLMGYAAGTILAAILTVLAINTRIGTDFLETMTAMFNPLPAISLLPLALIWFGLGASSLVFVLVHSVLWAVALNTHSGFLGVSRTLRMVGANYGLSGFSYVVRILIPAAFPSILTGLKIGWAFAWRTLIAAELVFGVSSGQGGLGWFIFENRNLLDIPAVFAGLLTVIVIGLVVENLVFQTIERHTIQKWGMKE